MPEIEARNTALRRWLWGSCYFLKVAEQLRREETDRELWLSQVQKRLGLVTTENLSELEVIKARRVLANA